MGRPGGPGPLDPIFDEPFTTGLFAFNNTPGVTPLAVTINKAVGQDDPTDATPILFTVVFSEAVTSFTGADVTLTGTAGATTAVVSGTGPTYTVTVSGMSTSGGVTANILAGVTTAVSSGQANSHSTSTDNTVAFSAPPPISLALVGTPMTGLNLPYHGDYLASLEYLIVSDIGASQSYIVDVSTNSPSIVGSAFVLVQYTDACWYDEDHAFAIARDSSPGPFDGVYPINTSVPSAPTTGTIAVTTQPIWLRLHGDRLLVASNAGTRVMTVSTPSTPVVNGLLAGVAGRMVGDPNDPDIVYVGSSTNIVAVDISVPGIPVSVGSVSLSPAGAALDVTAVGDVLYFVSNGFVGTVDISNPTGLTLLDTLGVSSLGGSGQGGICVEPNGLYGYACGANNPNPAVVSAFDFSDPTDIQFITSVTNASLANPIDIHIDGDRLFVVSQFPRVCVIEITR